MAEQLRRFEAAEMNGKWAAVDNHNGRRSVTGRGDLARDAAEKLADQLEANHRKSVEEAR